MTHSSPNSPAYINTAVPEDDRETRASGPVRRRRSKSPEIDQSTVFALLAQTARAQAESPIRIQVETLILDTVEGRSEYKGTPRGLEPLIQCIRRYVEAHADRFVVQDDPTTPGGRIITLVDGVSHS